MPETTISPRNNFSFNINANGNIPTSSPTATIVNNSAPTNPTQKRVRASGEVLNFLISEFENNPSPSPDRRKYISQKAQMNEKAVRIWFQNRRAKQKKYERSLRQGHSSVSSASSSYSNFSPGGSSSFGKELAAHHTTFDFIQKHVPIEINEKYSFIDCTSLSVGSWQRIKSGIHQQSLLQNNLINLSPFNLNNVMQQVDLLVLLSRKNHELNYFFSATSNDSKILFRIFYPISAISRCSLHDNLVNSDNNELKIHLCHQPKFSVYFFNGLNSTTNQWSICDDFSEGQQVSRAYSSTVDAEYKFKDFEPTTSSQDEKYDSNGEEHEEDEEDNGNSDVPHVLVGSKIALNYLSTYISQSIVGLADNNLHINNLNNESNPTHASVSKFGIPPSISAPAEATSTSTETETSTMKHHSLDLGIPFHSGQGLHSIWPNDLSSLALDTDIVNNNSNNSNNSNDFSSMSRHNISAPSSSTATAVTTFNGSPFSTTSNQLYSADTPQSSQSFGNFVTSNKLDPLHFNSTKTTTSPEDVLSLSSDHQLHAFIDGTSSSSSSSSSRPAKSGQTNDSTGYVHVIGHHADSEYVGISENLVCLSSNDFDNVNFTSGGDNGVTPSEFQSTNLEFIDF
ncbi:PHO2 [Candida theae]|uniref:PHO2 n=1 Tax=Candida theae TaxID=1198502 RepID=A0AAD5BG92_9ASCO|nr:PHO2 [Candida theae]KAI5960277.1 PHO2 [Candida theae]